MKFEDKVAYFIFFYIVVLVISPKRYNVALPTIAVYPDNSEVKKVISAVKLRNQEDIDFFEKTDPSVVYAFEGEVNMERKELTEIIVSVNPIVYFFKYIINRARPYQVVPDIAILDSKTVDTPSYPSGHAFQAYYLAGVLGDRYPEKRDIFKRIARRCDEVRVTAGIHYPSDGEFSKRLVNYIFNY